MKIHTEEYALSRSELFWVLIHVYRRKFILWFAIALSIFMGLTIGVRGAVLFLAIFLGALLMIIWRYVCSKGNKSVFSRRSFEIDDEFISHMSDSSSGRIKIDSLIKVFRYSKYFLLYIADSHFIYLPMRAFTSDSDIQEFELLLRTKKLLKY